MFWQVHVAWLKSGTAVLAFRGTATMQDSLQDVKFLRRNIDYMQELYPGTKAHVGRPEDPSDLTGSAGSLQRR